MDVVTIGGTETLLMAATLAEGHDHPRKLRHRTRSRRFGGMPRQNGREKSAASAIGNYDCRGVKSCTAADTARQNYRPHRSPAPSSAPSLHTGGKVVSGNARSQNHGSRIDKLVEAGAIIPKRATTGFPSTCSSGPKAVDRTVVHPGFLTDMQAQLMAMNAVC